MGTELWVDHKQAIWNVLPLHPQPQPLESITSYITRLAEANGLQSINELGALVGGMTFSSLKKNPDYPTVSYPGLAHISGHCEDRWLDMTFFHLIQYFGQSLHPSVLHQFLTGSIATSFRYCPVCLAEHTPAYYSLLWRFLLLPGCSEHGVRFLDQCGHCRSPLPLWRRTPQLTRCPTCQGDLRTGLPDRLSSDDVEPTDKRTSDLKMLLTPPTKTSGGSAGKTHRKTVSVAATTTGSLDTRGRVSDGPRDICRPRHRLCQEVQASKLERLHAVC